MLGRARVASFDIGRKNFAQYVEEVDFSLLETLKQEYLLLPKKKQRRVGGPMNEDVADILERICVSGRRVQTGVYDLRGEAGDTLDMETRKNIINHLEDHIELWDSCNAFVIEQQFFKQQVYKGKGTQANVKAIKVAEIVSTWFLTMYPTRVVEFFGSQNKTQMLGAPYGLGDTQRKRWATRKAREIYTKRGDIDMIDIFQLSDAVKGKPTKTQKQIDRYTSFFLELHPERQHSTDILTLVDGVVQHQKLDDISDCVVQLQAWLYRTFVACF